MTALRTLAPIALLTAVAAIVAGCSADTFDNPDERAAKGRQTMRLSIESPPNHNTTRAKAIQVTGRVTRGATVEVNGDAASVTRKRFSARVTLAIGQNRLRIVARKDGYGTKRRTLTIVRRPKPRPTAVATPEPTPAPTLEQSCDPNYEGACLDPNSYDYDCEGGSGDGPDYTGEVQVVGDDPYDLDRDGDGVACEP